MRGLGKWEKEEKGKEEKGSDIIIDSAEKPPQGFVFSIK
jgi:hypothetical protein